VQEKVPDSIEFLLGVLMGSIVVFAILAVVLLTLGMVRAVWQELRR
jgi:hypothetical protein